MASRLATWKPPQLTPWQRFRRQPAVFLAFWLHQRRPTSVASATSSTTTDDAGSSAAAITVVCLSDTHLAQPDVPDGDVLLHAGDLTNDGSFEELQAQLDWLASLPHRYKVVIAGNHDRLLDAEYVARFPDRICETEGRSRTDLDWHDLMYLNNSSSRSLEFDLDVSSTAGQKMQRRRLTVFGSPQTPQCGTFAFQYPPIRDVWAGAVPEGADVLLTHGPPRGYLDLEGKGCPHLLREVVRARPRMVVFGHIHAGYGRQEIGYGGLEGVYQRIMIGDERLVLVLGLVFWFLVEWLQYLVFISTLGYVAHPRGGTRTTMINAAVAVGSHEQSRKVVTINV